MTILSENTESLTDGSHKSTLIQCDSRKNEKCLGTFLREWRVVVKQRARTLNKDYCKFCQKTEEFSGRNNPNTKYKTLDDSFLDIIDTPEKAYLLGWIASDGTIALGSITISIRDYDILTIKSLRNIICAEIPIVEHNNTNMCSITFSSMQLVNAVIKHLGLSTYGKKDSLVRFPEHIAENLKTYFVRGYFEGDGSISLKSNIPRVSIASNSLEMLESIKKWADCGNIYSKIQWQTSNGGDAIKFLKSIYANTSVEPHLILHRKYALFEKYSDWVPSVPGAGGYYKYDSPFGLIKFNKCSNKAVLPNITDIHASGIDIHLVEKIKEISSDVTLYGTGLKVTPPPGYYFILVGRSSISKSGFSLANAIGIIDENYVGEIMVALRNHENKDLILPNRLVQLILVPKVNFQFVLVDTLEDTTRGEGGFGSTGI